VTPRNSRLVAEDRWELHPQLVADTAAVGDLPLCRVLLMDDANYSWLILVPRRPDVVEVLDLSASERAVLMEEVAQAADALRAITACDKLNIAALGNVVSQLHVHVIARFRSDLAWPRPVWGVAPARRHTPAELAGVLASLREALPLAG
jgi:diadenosine tetraphosphate (Ap4A) HIT family hydrolase